MSKRSIQILAAPETNLFLFAFLLNFVYEVWQAPYYEFYGSPSLAAKINDLTHCTFGDGVIILVSSWVVSALVRSRDWVLHPTLKSTVLFTSIGLLYTLAIETYRVNVSSLWGASTGSTYSGDECPRADSVDCVTTIYPLSGSSPHAGFCQISEIKIIHRRI